MLEHLYIIESPIEFPNNLLGKDVLRNLFDILRLIKDFFVG
jgi:hypothetical protein